MPTIAALVKHVPDTWSEMSLEDDFTLDRESVDNVIDEINEYSVEQALRLRDDNPDKDFRVVALTVGPAAADAALRKALAMGADDAVHVTDESLSGADALSTAWVLNHALNALDDVQIVTMGERSADGQTGLVAGFLSEYRQVPALTCVSSVALAGDELTAVRDDARGRWELTAPLPAIVSVGEEADKPRFPTFKKLMAAKKHDVTVYDVAQLGIDPIAPTTQVTDATKRPPREAGETIEATTPEETAKKIADFLADRNLL